MHTAASIPGIEIHEELGRGAHSIVYRAVRDGAACAVKVPLSKARWTRWIYREAVALARVRHPGLPQVIEVGDVDGRPYLVMELVRGVTLATALAKGGTFEEARVLGLGRELTSILGAVHRAGLIHRDVKPRNILIDASGRARLVDFGFAAPMERAAEHDLAGTEAYAAPEQFIAPPRIDGRSDLYSLGRVLLECATGRIGLRDEPEDAAARLRAVGASPGFVAIVTALLAFEPSERYESALAVSEDLQRVTSGADPLGPTRKRRLPELPLVARDRELAITFAVLESMRDPVLPVGHVVQVVGRKGAGKTHFLGTVAGRAPALVLDVTCAKDDPPLAVLRRLLRRYAEAAPAYGRSDPASDVRTAAGNLQPVLQLVAPEFAGEGSAPTLLAPDTLPEAAAAILLGLAAVAGPTLLIVDDVQWLDPSTRSVLERLVHRLRGARLSIVIARRSDCGVPADWALAAQPSGYTHLDLDTLTPADVGRLARSYLGVDDLPAPLLDRLNSISDGTPLGVIELVRAYLDSGALRPHRGDWQFDGAKADAVVLPKDAASLIVRRFGELALADRRSLAVAAVIGRTFEDELLARVLGVAPADVGYALAAAERAGLLVRSAFTHRFVHDSLREAILDGLDRSTLRATHQSIAVALEADGGPVTIERLCVIATHYAAGELQSEPERAYEANVAAAKATVARFDNESALGFLTAAREAARVAGLSLPASHHRMLGEVVLRLGRYGESLAAFEEALACANEAEERGEILGRIAWVHQTQAEPDLAWRALEKAFDAVGARMPVENARSAARTTYSLVRALRPVPAEPSSQRRVELLCRLHYQNARMGAEYGRPFRLLQSSLAGVELSALGAPVDARIRAFALHGFVLTALTMRERGKRVLEEAQSLAQTQSDPLLLAFCIQLRSVAAGWAGRLQDALDLMRECVDIYGPWLELNEYCLDTVNSELVEASRGNLPEAWGWVERSLARMRRSRTQPAVAEYIVHCARADMAALGMDSAEDPWLNERLSAFPPTSAGQGFHRMIAWGPRLRFYVEMTDFGPEFAALVREFDAQKYDPRNVHPTVWGYYVGLCHGRMHQCLRAPRRDAALIKLLRKAVRDLRASARIDLLRAHALLGEGFLAWQEGDERKANKLLAEAETLAGAESAPWVLYGVARTRAHMLRDAGRASAAVDQARIAEMLAREHGAVQRARWVREEFALAEPKVDVSVTRRLSRAHSSSSRSNRQLAALLQVAKAPRRNLNAEEQAAAVLDELSRLLSARFGALVFTPEPNARPCFVGRSAGEARVMDAATQSALTRLSQHSWSAEEERWAEDLAQLELDTSFVAAAPLYLYERRVGAIMLRRNAEDRPFGPEDHNLLRLLSHQVPIALEMARLLFEREQMHASLQHAKKMEAMGALAGGLAHDFNNMLAAMRVALGAAQDRAAHDEELTIELDIISQATTRAAQLTSQLLSFSRHQPAPVTTHDANQLVANLEPMLRRIVGGGISLSVELSPGGDTVEVDQGGFDQALVNLIINARDAMPSGGQIAIKTRSVILSEEDAQRANVGPGEYVELTISDTGEGMSADTMTRIFEPFFTTKAPGSGTGLGLAMVYAFARNSGGSVQVSSELGKGTRFTIYLKRVASHRVAGGSRASRSSPPVRAEERPHNVRSSAPPRGPEQGAEAPKRSSSLRLQGNPDTILVVDDDELVRRSIAKILERNGYRVVAVSGSVEAIDVARQQGGRIALVILDVLMPGVTGPELGRRLGDLNLEAKMLFVSGFAPESIPIEQARVTADMLLQKPFSQTTLLERVRQLMHH